MKHETAQTYLLMAQDGALSARDAELLGQHLRECAECRAVARELEEMETQLRYQLKVRYPTVSSAEILLPKARLKATLTPRQRVLRHFAPLATGVMALVILVGALLYATQQFLPNETAAQQTSTMIAAIVTELPSLTPSLPPTDEPTDEPTVLPTVEVVVTDALSLTVPTATVEQATPILEATDPLPTATLPLPPTDIPPTNEPPPPTAVPPTAIPPTAMAIPPTATPMDESDEVDADVILAQLDAYVAALNGESADTIINFFVPKPHYGTGEGRRTQERELLSAEFNALRVLNSHFVLDKCRPNLMPNATTKYTANCELRMTNDWRNALGLSPYISQFSVSFDDDLSIISLTDYQYRDGVAPDWNRVQAFQAWLSTANPQAQSQYMRGNPTNFLRYANPALMPYASQWVAAGQP